QKLPRMTAPAGVGASRTDFLFEEVAGGPKKKIAAPVHTPASPPRTKAVDRLPSAMPCARNASPSGSQSLPVQCPSLLDFAVIARTPKARPTPIDTTPTPPRTPAAIRYACVRGLLW